MGRPATLLLMLIGAMLAMPAGAAEVGRARAVAGPDLLRLEDGSVVRLAALHVPPGQALAARQALRQATDRAPEVLIVPVGLSSDRYGRRPAQVRTSDGETLAALLVRRGLAVVQPSAGVQLDYRRLLSLERDARDAVLGLWREADRPFAVAGRAAGLIGRYGVVEGEVHSVGSTEHHVYLNFDDDWRSDFTLRVRRAELERTGRRSVEDVERLAGRTVRARGFVVEAGGPLIEISHPEQIEVLR